MGWLPDLEGYFYFQTEQEARDFIEGQKQQGFVGVVELTQWCPKDRYKMSGNVIETMRVEQ